MPPIFFFLLKKSSLEDVFDFSEEGRDRVAASHMCGDGESKPQLFHVQDEAPTKEVTPARAQGHC